MRGVNGLAKLGVARARALDLRVGQAERAHGAAEVAHLLQFRHQSVHRILLEAPERPTFESVARSCFSY
jgi:hypothetical protein